MMHKSPKPPPIHPQSIPSPILPTSQDRLRFIPSPILNTSQNRLRFILLCILKIPILN